MLPCGNVTQPTKRKVSNMKKTEKRTNEEKATDAIALANQAASAKPLLAGLEIEEGMTPDDIAKAMRMVDAGREVLHACVAVGEKYLNLCRVIRTEEIAPRIASKYLMGLGFTKETVSKINRVAQTPNELWSEFEARRLGFNKVLELARAPVQEAIAEASGQNVIDVKAEVEAMEGEPEAGASSEDVDSVQAAHQKRLESAIASVLREAEFFNLRRKTVKGSNGWQLVVTKSKAKRAKKD